MNIRKATRKYEKWLASSIPVVPADLEKKHELMNAGPFPFFRATYYRWAQQWLKICADLENAPRVLAIGDLHVENFGTWRDIEGRLIWGVNDFDEAARLPYTNDLARLATSAHLAIESHGLHSTARDACDAILAGYTSCLETGGQAFVLAENHSWLRSIALGELRDPVKYWDKMSAWPRSHERVPGIVRRQIERLLPDAGIRYRVVHRIAGLGSLGRRRFVALGLWRGAYVAREAKQLTAPATGWARQDGPVGLLYGEMLARSVRCPDPFVGVRGGWIFRRLAPDCSRIELASLAGQRDEAQLFHAMGWETANVHIGSRKAAKILDDVRGRPKGWLHDAARAGGKSVLADWQNWRNRKKAAK